MAKNALQEQLAKAGLVDEERLRKEDRRPARPRRGGRRRQQRQADQRPAPQASLAELIYTNYLPRFGAELDYHFTEGPKVRWIAVTREQRRALANGEAAIVAVGDAYELVPRDVAEQLRSSYPDALRVLNPRSSSRR
ncbi:DUF2058 family protein [Halorhodospira neutriphila]|nr:DUF2058 family protein [Halorhodospira neutriphila]